MNKHKKEYHYSEKRKLDYNVLLLYYTKKDKITCIGKDIAVRTVL